MKTKTITTIILILLALLLALIVGARVGLIQHEAAAHVLTLAATAPDVEPEQTHRPLDLVDPTPPMRFRPVVTPATLSTPTPTITPVEEQPVVGQPEQGRYGTLLLTADEIETLARLVRLEAGGESFEGQQAVAEVVLNRVLSPVYPGNVYDVVYQSGQFTPASQIPYTSAGQTQYAAVDAALRGPNILPQQVLYFAVGPNGRSQIWGWIGNHCFCY